MFSRARLTLTLVYSGIFLACFWIFSFGLYAWMEQSFEVEVGEQIMRTRSAAGPDLGEIVVDINEAALDQLGFILTVFNLALLGLIPALSWYLTGRTLEPVRKAHDAQRQFVSNAAHELRTPLTILQSEIEIALNKTRSIEEYRATLVSSQQEIARLSDLTERLLFLARHDNGKAVLAFESIDLTDLLTTVLATHRTPIAEKRLSLTFVPPDESVSVSGDPMMLSQLFANLVDNAIKYTPRAGRITATITYRDARVLIEIADTGIGIAPELHESIFASFVRADVSRGETKGYGLGLSICRAIAQAHNGSVAVASKPGQGSAFSVELPRA